MIRNTEPRTWHGIWYLPESDNGLNGVLDYEPDDGFRLTVMSEGFESPWVEVDRTTTIFQPPVKASVIGPRDLSSPYPAIYGEADGKLITLFDVYGGGTSQKYGSQAPYSQATYYPEAMIIGSHIPNKKSRVFRSLNVSIDFLHVWLQDTGWLQVGMKLNANSASRVAEYFTRVETGNNDRPLRGVTLEDGTALTIGHCGILPGLKWSAYEYESRSSISASVRLAGTEGPRSLDSFQTTVLALETLISVCLDRQCKPYAFDCELWEGDNRSSVELLMPRRGLVPSVKTSGEYLRGLAFCDESRRFSHYFERWFPFYDQHSSALSLLNGFLAEDGARFLEPSVMMSQTLLEAFHKSVYGKKLKDLLPSSIEAAERLRPSRSADEKKRVTMFKRALDLYHRLPADVRQSLVPNEEKWAGSLLDARNDITHEGGLRKVEPLQANAAANVAVAVVTVHVLMYLGTESESILQSLSGSTSLAKAKNQAREYLA